MLVKAPTGNSRISGPADSCSQWLIYFYLDEYLNKGKNHA